MIHGLLLALLLTAPLQDTTYKVSGTVIRDDKQDPETAAQANQIRLSGPTTSIINIGPGGAFEFPNVRPGSYQLVVGPRITMTPVPVTVTDKDVNSVRLVVPVTAGVTGNVTVDGGAPRPRFQVIFTRIDATGAAPVTATAAPSFTVTLQPGQYRITTTGLAAGYSLKSITMGDVDVLGQPLTVTTQAASQILSISLGVSSPPPWVKVSGRVTGGAATTVSMSGAAMAETLNTTVGSNGAFEFPMVLPGTYSARTLPATVLPLTTAVIVGSANVTDVELRIPATKEVAGKITLRGNFPIPRLTFSLTPLGAVAATAATTTLSIVNGEIVTTAAGGVNVAANPGADGLFKVTLPDGERRITIIPSSLPAGYIVESFTYGTTDLLKSPLQIALSDKLEMSIVLDATQVKPHGVSGKVTGLLTTQGVRVVLTGGTLGPGVESPIAPDGSFAFADIIPGSYQARLSLSGVVISTSVRVDNQDLTDLIITYPRRFAVIAHVIVEGDSPDAANPPMTLEARSSAGTVVTSSTGSGVAAPAILTLSDGEHTITVPKVPAGYQVKSIMYGTTNLQKAPLKIDGPITWEIVLRLVKTTP